MSDWKNTCLRIYQRDRGRCQTCGKYAPEGTAHHCYFRSQHVDWREEDWNQEWICRNCHQRLHDEKGKLKEEAQLRANQRKHIKEISNGRL